jgi:hypothetical protein
MSITACFFLLWSAPHVFGAQIVEYPTHYEISQDLSKLHSEVAVLRAYMGELQNAEVRKRLTIAEQNIATTSRDIRLVTAMGWFIITGVFFPYFKDAWAYYSRVGRRKRRREAVADAADNAAEDAAEVEIQDQVNERHRRGER